MRTGPEAAHLLVLHPITHLESGETDTVAHIPHLASFVPRRRQELFAGPVPGESINSTGVPGKLPLGLAILAVIEENFPIKAPAGPVVAIG